MLCSALEVSHQLFKMAGLEETEKAFNFWELIAMLDEKHEEELLELKERLEEKELEVSELNTELERKEAARKEADERADFWYKMIETSKRLVRLESKVIHEKVSTDEDSFLEVGQRNPGRKKHTKKKCQKNLKKMTMNWRAMMQRTVIQRSMNQETMNLKLLNPRTMNPRTMNQNQRIMNSMSMNQRTMKPLMTMPTRIGMVKQ